MGKSTTLSDCRTLRRSMPYTKYFKVFYYNFRSLSECGVCDLAFRSGLAEGSSSCETDSLRQTGSTLCYGTGPWLWRPRCHKAVGRRSPRSSCRISVPRPFGKRFHALERPSVNGRSRTRRICLSEAKRLQTPLPWIYTAGNRMLLDLHASIQYNEKRIL